ncbi:MAG: glycoside hydrolase family 9 protein [Saprospirales bacterium]|nr:glycoside hydrolase family 9 protein [Saprospirales bacterium]
MRLKFTVFLPLSACFFSAFLTMAQPNAWIRINQLGYLEKDLKVAVLVSKTPLQPTSFELCDALTGQTVFWSTRFRQYGPYAAFSSGYRLDFSAFSLPGAYYVQAGDIRSPVFRIANDVYDGTADFILKYMRQQRCGYNPFLRDSCHTRDGFIIYHPDPVRDSMPIDAFGGWHDASDYLQYLPTTANAVFQLLFAYRQHPESFGDRFDAAGLPGANGIPDVLDEAKWGLDWMRRLNPAPGEYYNQVADDRDHRGMRLPTRDTFSYGAPDGSLARPVYFIDGKPQGAFRYKNRTQGAASSAGKFAAAFALGSEILAPFYPAYARDLRTRALEAYVWGKNQPGFTQTAPCRAPYFYEEENWVDDMENAAAQLDRRFPGKGFAEEAVRYGHAEPVTPWMGSDTARHYQWYPFINLGHYFLAHSGNSDSADFRRYLRRGIDSIFQRGQNNPFLFGVPFIWCSNNLVAAACTQARLYRTLTGDSSRLEMEYALRDWLFGCNPWGVSMVIGLPSDGVWPRDPHSAFTHLHHYPIDGGLVDGPIYGSIWNKLIGITLYQPDEYAAFQSPLVAYHDDYGDYSSNEPTMDGTASLSYLLAALQAEGQSRVTRDAYGALIRSDSTQKVIRLIFTAHDHTEGVRSILKTLRKNRIKGSFFLTGDACRRQPGMVRQIKAGGHYLGVHSDRHLLYCDWQRRDSLLVSKAEFRTDLRENFKALKQAAGVIKPGAYMFIPPYEWYNDSIIRWSRQAGLRLFNFTPGTLSQADYTTPAMPNYRPSETIYQSILECEQQGPNGLNGFHLLIHLGAGPDRPDKFYRRLDQLIRELKARGYRFQRW